MSWVGPFIPALLILAAIFSGGCSDSVEDPFAVELGPLLPDSYLKPVSATDTSVVLWWTGVDGEVDHPTHFEVRYNLVPPGVAGWWSNGTPVVPAIPDFESVVVADLDPDTEYFFAMRDRMVDGTWSAPLPAGACRTAPLPVTRLIPDYPDFNRNPRWSPEGGRIAYQSRLTGQENTQAIAISPADGGLIRYHAVPGRILSDPDWSPDGTRIVCTDWNVLNENRDSLWMLDPETGEWESLETAAGDGMVSSPAWSPDGLRIVYAVWAAGGRNLWVTDLATGQHTSLTHGEQTDGDPSWSPDGTRIAFHSDRSGEFQIYTMDTDGSSVEQVTTAGGMDPDWSPDGTALAFERLGDDGNRDVEDIWFRTLATGQEFRMLPAWRGSEDAAWSPDGTRIAAAFELCQGHWEIWTLAPGSAP